MAKKHLPCTHDLDTIGKLEEGECHGKCPCSAKSLENQSSFDCPLLKCSVS